MKFKFIASVLLAVLLLLVVGCKRVEDYSAFDDKGTLELPLTRSVETVMFKSERSDWVRIWDMETGVVCYRPLNTNTGNSCAYSPNKPYPLRDEVGDDHNQ